MRAEYGLINHSTDWHLIKDSIGELPHLETVLFAVLEHALFLVRVVLLQRANLMVAAHHGNCVGAEELDGDHVQRALQSPLATVHVIAKEEHVGPNR